MFVLHHVPITKTRCRLIQRLSFRQFVKLTVPLSSDLVYCFKGTETVCKGPQSEVDRTVASSETKVVSKEN